MFLQSNLDVQEGITFVFRRRFLEQEHLSHFTVHYQLNHNMTLTTKFPKYKCHSIRGLVKGPKDF